jgi:hypothetical protein
MKIEIVCSSKTSVDFHWTVCCCITEDRTLPSILNFVGIWIIFSIPNLNSPPIRVDQLLLCNWELNTDFVVICVYLTFLVKVIWILFWYL